MAHKTDLLLKMLKEKIWFKSLEQQEKILNQEEKYNVVSLEVDSRTQLQDRIIEGPFLPLIKRNLKHLRIQCNKILSIK